MPANVLFVDTGFWYALQVGDDRHHVEAARVFAAVHAGGYLLETSHAVVGETYTLLSRTHGHAQAIAFVDVLGQSDRLERLVVDQEIDDEAYALMRRFSDPAFSYVDATSFALMRRRRLRLALAFDHHFSVAGFVRVPADQAL